MSVHVVLMAHRDSLLAKTLHLQGNKLANIRKNEVLTNISEYFITIMKKCCFFFFSMYLVVNT